MTVIDRNLIEALRLLAPREREVVELRVRDGQSVEQIAAKLALPARQVRIVLARALRQVRRRLKRAARRK